MSELLQVIERARSTIGMKKAIAKNRCVLMRPSIFLPHSIGSDWIGFRFDCTCSNVLFHTVTYCRVLPRTLLLYTTRAAAPAAAARTTDTMAVVVVADDDSSSASSATTSRSSMSTVSLLSFVIK